MSKIHDKLRKLLVLASRGEGGEALNAQNRLEALMSKHDISLEDIDDNRRQLEWFKHKPGKYEKSLMHQIMITVLKEDPLPTYKHKSKRYFIGAETTKAEKIEIELRYSAYLPEMKQEFENTYTAFLLTNNLFPEIAGAGDVDAEELDKEELDKLVQAMQGMTPVQIRRELK